MNSREFLKIISRIFTKDKKWHWYSFTFTNSKESITTYRGYSNKYLRLKDIELARERCNISMPAVTMDISYLGRMTVEFFDENSNGTN